MEPVLVVVLVAYNNLLNRWPPFNGPLYIPLNLLFASVVVVLGLGPLGLDANEIGLSVTAGGVIAGLIAGAAVVSPLFLVALGDRTGALIADRRVGGLAGARLAYQVIVRVPLGTAAVEEVLFRGVLFAAFRSRGDLAAALVSSLCFGLWHIGPTINLVAANRPDATARVYAGAAVGAVALTTGVGLILVWLRIQTGELGLPIGVHSALNSLGTVAAVMAYRRLA
jgi:membrane protease YdiL (CAAX protease family)